MITFERSILIVAILIIVSSILLFILGWRGKRINSHPVCRKCKFDLYGGWPKSTTCPECGGDATTHPKGPRIGVRNKRPLFLLVSIVLLLTGGGGIGFSIWGQISGYNWNQIKPDMWLEINTHSNDPDAVKNALIELTDRFADNAISVSRIQRLIDRGLTHQSDESVGWVSEWGALIEEAWAQQKLTYKQKQQYARAVINLRLETSGTIQENRPWEISLLHSGGRQGKSRIIGVKTQCANIEIDQISTPNKHRGYSIITAQKASRGNMSWDNKIYPEVGIHDVTCLLDVTVILDYSPDSNNRSKIEEWRQANFTIPLQSKIEIVPADTELVHAIHDPTIKQQVMDSFRFYDVTIKPFGSKNIVYLSMSVEVNNLPVPISYDVVALDQNNQEWKLGSINCLALPPFSSYATHLTNDNNINNFVGDMVTLVFLPNKEHAEKDPDMDSYWDSEIVFPNIPLIR